MNKIKDYRIYLKIKKEELKKIKDWQMLPEEKRKIICQEKKEKERILLSNYNHKRRIQIKDSYVRITVQDWQDILKKQNNICLFCKQEFSEILYPTQDHIIPLSKNGKHQKENIQALCSKCNSKKGKKLITFKK